MLAGYISEIEFCDSTNREGHAAKVYFNGLFGMDFSRNADNATNAALNYGYGLVLSATNREVVANGYLTQLGLFHDNMFNQFNLGCDIMEPFRTIVDRKVREIMPKAFGKEEKRIILQLLNCEFVIDGRRQTLLNTIKIYVKSIISAIESGDISNIKFYKYEL